MNRSRYDKNVLAIAVCKRDLLTEIEELQAQNVTLRARAEAAEAAFRQLRDAKPLDGI